MSRSTLLPLLANGEFHSGQELADALGVSRTAVWKQVNRLAADSGIAVETVKGRGYRIPGGLDLSAVPAANITTTTNSLGGHTTRYLIPTEKLPLLQPLRDIGIPENIVAQVEKPPKAVVDAGYARHDAGPTGAARRPAAPAAKGAGASRSSTPKPAAKARSVQRHSKAAA